MRGWAIPQRNGYNTLVKSIPCYLSHQPRIGRGEVFMQRTRTDRQSLATRQDIRRTALRLANAIQVKDPDALLAIDTDTVDGEDAFVWVQVQHGVRSGTLCAVAERLSRRIRLTTGFWIVPRIVTAKFDTEPRLRPRLFDLPRPLTF